MRKFLLGALLLSVTFIQAENLKLQRIKDGDTVVFNKGVTCRLSYVDTPESYPNKKATRDVANCNGVTLDEVITSGRYAKRYLGSIMQKGSTYNVDIKGEDRYGRSICVIYNEQKQSINEMLVRNGFAVPYWRYIKDYNTRSRMKEYVRHAQSNNKGLWRTHRAVMECMN